MYQRTFRINNLFIPYIIIETIFVLAFIWRHGFSAFFVETILSLIIGALLISRFGILDFANEVRRITPQSVFGSFGTVFGGFLLLLPGILSDIVGIILIVVSLVMRCFDKFADKNTKNSDKSECFIYEYGKFNKTNSSTLSENSNIIDVEIIE
ncbi:MAG: FxsA family protein [Campylobacter sp.]|nr:FxsA family protein [Campylobacter sp.]